MAEDFVSKIRPECEKALKFFEGELREMRTARPSPALIEDIKVNCFGTECPLKQLAAISLIEGRQILIEPWDKSYFEPIQQAMQKSGLGFSVVVEKENIRLAAPALTEDYRKNLLRILGEKKERVRQAIRRLREKVWGDIQEKTREGEVTEDEKYKLKDELQDLVDEYNEKIEELVERKQKEIEG